MRGRPGQRAVWEDKEPELRRAGRQHSVSVSLPWEVPDRHPGGSHPRSLLSVSFYVSLSRSLSLLDSTVLLLGQGSVDDEGDELPVSGLNMNIMGWWGT